MKALLAGCCAVLFVAVAGCGGSNCADGSCGDTSAGFTLQTCTADSQCQVGSACLPEKCDGTCAPDANGRCQPCPAAGSGLCMPTSTGTGTAPTSPACFAGRLGDPSACGIDVDWGRKAVDTCGAQGAELIDLHALLTCPDGRPSGVVFTCCSFDGGTTLPPPPPPTDACIDVPVGDGSCDATIDLKMRAIEACANQGLEMGNVTVRSTCADGMPGALIVSCCKGGIVAPPDPGACQEIPIPGDPSIDPKEMATRMCQDQNLALQDLKPLDMDSAGNVFTWIAVCCGGAVTPPDPPPTGTCTEIPVKADPSNPDPEFSDPKMAAYQQCRAMGLDLQDLRPDAPDAAGVVYLWWATCCGGTVTPPEPPPGTCTQISLTVTSADPQFDAKQIAWDQCAAQGLLLQDLQAGPMDPATALQIWTATCCEAAVQPPPPDPATCTTIPIGDGTCGTNVDFKTRAWDQCRLLNLVLRDLAIRNTCADGTIGAVIATCCP